MDNAASERERARLAALMACAVMDTPAEPAFNNIVFATAQLFRAPIALLGLVNANRSWAKAWVGPIQQSQLRQESFCSLITENGQLTIVEDASVDSRFAGLPWVVDEPRVRFFAGAPVLGPREEVLGALCACNRYPHSVPDQQLAQLSQLAVETSQLLCLRSSSAQPFA